MKLTDNTKVHCFFEQSGAFKKAFRRLGYTALDYDLKNDFAQTDVIIDLFEQIKLAYYNRASIFDNITPEDLIFAFFPCIYFSQYNQLFFRGDSVNFQEIAAPEKIETIIERSRNREIFYEVLLMLCYVCERRNLRLIIENPYSPNHYLINNFPYRPSVIDWDRSKRGDYFKKPTMYIFVNCTAHQGLQSIDRKYTPQRIEYFSGCKTGGTCNVERSMISPEYAENFINDYILGRKTPKTELTLF